MDLPRSPLVPVHRHSWLRHSLFILHCFFLRGIRLLGALACVAQTPHDKLKCVTGIENNQVLSNFDLVDYVMFGVHMAHQ